jgi:transposase
VVGVRTDIVFIDECGFMMNPVVRRTWAPRGHTPVLRITDPHGRISAAGALSISAGPTTFAFYFHLLRDNQNFRGNSIVAFVESVRQRINRPLIVIWDQIPIHQSRPVERYVREHSDVMLEPLPPYAPELNAVDYVWAYVKYQRLGNYCPLSLDELRTRVSAELSRVRGRPDLLASFFHATGLTL